MMKLHTRCLLSWLLLTLCILVTMGSAVAAEEAEDEMGIRKYGVIHNIAEDRKVEKIGGTYEPEGLDKYLKRRLDEVNSRLDQVTAHLERIDQKLEDLKAKPQGSDKQ